MSDEPRFTIPQEWVTKLVIALVTALLGTNIYQRVASDKDLTRDAAAWDTVEWTNQRDANKRVLAALERLEGKP